jgi:biopolymer transport protein ExbB/TolQ
MRGRGREGAGAFGLWLGGGTIFYVIGIALYALFGGIFSAIAALFYNLAAGWVGGLQVEME